jgi:cell division septation protein DedD
LHALATETPDDGFHEIQLNGKQLVFLFMAATVVSVVIFLCGVLVGRDVKAERAASTSDANVAAIEPAPQPAPPPAATPSGSDPTTAAPPPTVDDLTYFNRLDKQAPTVEELKAPSQSAVGSHQPPVGNTQAPAVSPQTTATKPPAAAATTFAAPSVSATPAPVAPAASAGEGYAIQVAAPVNQGDAAAMARRLSSKGYNAFVLPLTETTPPRYRVRVGKFKTKREAEAIAARLQKEEQFKPWITR